MGEKMGQQSLNWRLTVLLTLLLTGSVWAQKQRITVTPDGSGDYQTVQAALNAVPMNNKNRVVIFIKKGVYKEKIKLDSSQHFVTLIGEDKNATILTYDDFSGKVLPDGTKLRTSTSGSFYICGNDFRAENLTFANTAGSRSGVPVGQAVAAFVTGDRAVFVNCRFVGNQDTLYTGMPDHPDRREARQYYKDCYIEGTVDFIFGSATVVFENCTIFSKSKGPYITAAATPEGKPFRVRVSELHPLQRRAPGQCVSGSSLARFCPNGVHQLPVRQAHPARRLAQLEQTSRRKNNALRRIPVCRAGGQPHQPGKLVEAVNRCRS